MSFQYLEEVYSPVYTISVLISQRTYKFTASLIQPYIPTDFSTEELHLDDLEPFWNDGNFIPAACKVFWNRLWIFPIFDTEPVPNAQF